MRWNLYLLFVHCKRTCRLAFQSYSYICDYYLKDPHDYILKCISTFRYSTACFHVVTEDHYKYIYKTLIDYHGSSSKTGSNLTRSRCQPAPGPELSCPTSIFDSGLMTLSNSTWQTSVLPRSNFPSERRTFPLVSSPSCLRTWRCRPWRRSLLASCRMWSPWLRTECLVHENVKSCKNLCKILSALYLGKIVPNNFAPFLYKLLKWKSTLC